MFIGTVQQIWRHPVKSMAGEKLNEGTVGPLGIPGDRGWALRDEKSGEITNGKRIPMLMECAARYQEQPAQGTTPSVEITFPDGTQVVTASFVYSLSNSADFTLQAPDNGYVCSNPTLAAGSATQVTVALPGSRASATTTLTVPPAPGTQAPLPGDMSISRDLVLERAALSERDKIDGMLSPSAKMKVNSVSEEFLNTLLRDNNDVDPSPFVREVMGREFGQLSQQQSDLLTFYTLAGVIQLLDERQARNSGEETVRRCAGNDPEP